MSFIKHLKEWGLEGQQAVDVDIANKEFEKKMQQPGETGHSDRPNGYQFIIDNYKFWYLYDDDMITVYKNMHTVLPGIGPTGRKTDEIIEPNSYEIVDGKHFIQLDNMLVIFDPVTKSYKVKNKIQGKYEGVKMNSFINYLKEDLDSANMMAGRSNIWFDRAKGGFEVYFKVQGITYSFLAESEGTEYEDGTWKIQLRKKWEGNTEMIEDTKEIHDAFTEAMMQWVELKNPTTFWWIWSEKYPAYNNIAKTLSKKLKQYNFVDESTLTKEEYDVVERAEEDKYKRFIFTRLELKEELTDKDWFEKKMDDFSKTTGVYEPVEEIKPNPDHTTPFNKNGKLDKGVEYKNKKLS